jgi:hypothetical protein
VWLAGGPRADARLAPLTDWASTHLGRRLRAMRGAEPQTLAGFDRAVDEHTGRTRAGGVLRAVICRAGLGEEVDLKPRSVAAWVGQQVVAETGRIDEAARRLGLRLLDLTAELTGFDWRPAALEEQ